MDLAYVALGTLIGVYSLPGVVAALPGASLASRLGDRRMVLTSLALMTTGRALMAVSPSYDALLAGRLLSGTGGAMLPVALPKNMLNHVPPATLPSLMGISWLHFRWGWGWPSLCCPCRARGGWQWRLAPWCALSLFSRCLWPFPNLQWP
jgi:MFS family permease